jgi:hypothetical protein
MKRDLQRGTGLALAKRQDGDRRSSRQQTKFAQRAYGRTARTTRASPVLGVTVDGETVG